MTHAVACAACVIDSLTSTSSSEQDRDDNSVDSDDSFLEEHHVCGIILYAIVFVVALPLLLCFAFLASAYLLIGCCLRCYSKTNKVQADANIQCNETTVDLQAAESTHHM